MKSLPDDKNLGPLLRAACRVSPARNPEFRAAVWARIEAARRTPATWAAWLRLNGWRFVSCALAGVVLAGAGGGWIAKSQSERDRERLMQRYLASIDPHQHLHHR
jgi:anti-sigma-K factor RskA